MASCLLVLITAGALSAVGHRPVPRPELDTEGRAPVLLSGCVVEPPVFSEDRTQFTLELERGARMRVSLYPKEGQPMPALAYGQNVEFEARVRRTRNFLNPGSFDYAHYLARRDIYWTASAGTGTPLQILPGNCGSRFERAIFGLRGMALERLERMYDGRPYETGMMEAILIGESSKLQKVWTDDFRSTGTFHALVISGTHVAVLAAFFLFLLRLCLLPEPAAVLLTVLASWLYALVTGWQAPVIRSAAGLTLFMIGRHFYRERRILNLVAAIAIAFLVLDPEQLLEPSFQLSFLSVGFIAALAIPLLKRTSSPLARGLEDLKDSGRDPHLAPAAAQFRVEMRLIVEALHLWLRLPVRLARWSIIIPAQFLFFLFELMVTSAVVQVGLALPMAVYFHRVSFSGVSANAVVVPLMGLVVPIGFVAVFTGWIWPARIASALLLPSRAVVEWHARWEPNWRIPSPPLWLAVAFAAALIAVALAQSFSKIWRVTATACVLVLLGGLIWHPFAPLVERGKLELTAIDVGQGDSLFAAFPDGSLMLMDGGGIPRLGKRPKSKLDIGEDVVSPYLWGRSIRRIDVLALSHAHEDHAGGVGALLQNFKVRELWTGLTPECPEWDALREHATRLGVKIVPLRRGTRFAYGGAQVEVLSPASDAHPGPAPRNNDSLALRLRWGQHSFVLTGDIERQVEAEMLSENLVDRADVLKVAHHGSKTSSTEAFLDAARPTFALISAGFENSYGHPHPDILKRLAERHAAVFRTDEWGLVSIRSDGHRFRIETARWSPPEFLESVF